MNVIEWFVAFYRPVPLRDIVRGRDSLRCIFGHVAAYGYTADDTWVFFDPEAAGTSLLITHHHDEVVDLIARHRATADLIVKLTPDGRKYRVPLHPPMNCVTQCAALLGRRAYSPAGFRRMLLREGAEVIHENAERRSRRQSRPAA